MSTPLPVGQTQTQPDTIQVELDKGNANTIPSCLQQMHLGTMLANLKVTFTSLSAAATYDITSTALFAHAAISGIDTTDMVKLPAARDIRTLRVTAASTGNTVGSYAITDAGGTAVSPTASTVLGIAKLSDDGTTLTFPTADVTGFIIEYSPRSATDPTSNYASS